ncbi:hypothetical protein [Actinomadura sp. NEAU-AAG7]|uniref:hypothetical protein n=1 Tax=Actinomadura sp. NEAU-AAG7 TaxID=2839640 RepID=UPI001BE4A7E5|nr:hypothetical protein [Actinomadura sp. NEAU-AAG7]MBT2212423.1 hypothetical protein [Actinomadura sp. NEAU-AAG7]
MVTCQVAETTCSSLRADRFADPAPELAAWLGVAASAHCGASRRRRRSAAVIPGVAAM